MYNNEKIKRVVEGIKKGTDESLGIGEHVIIIGDFNARIDDWQINEEGEEERSRSSSDKMINYEGRKLIGMCEEIGCKLKNGDTKGDWIGAQTYIGEGSDSVLDLEVES